MAALQAFIHPSDIPSITSIKILALQAQDSLAWLPDKLGKFSVHTAYRFAVKCF